MNRLEQIQAAWAKVPDALNMAPGAPGRNSSPEEVRARELEALLAKDMEEPLMQYYEGLIAASELSWKIINVGLVEIKEG